MKTRRITANLPVSLLQRAQTISGLGITETLIQGLELVLQKSSLESIQSLKGKIKLQEDRGRNRGNGRN